MKFLQTSFLLTGLMISAIYLSSCHRGKQGKTAANQLSGIWELVSVNGKTDENEKIRFEFYRDEFMISSSGSQETLRGGFVVDTESKPYRLTLQINGGQLAIWKLENGQLIIKGADSSPGKAPANAFAADFSAEPGYDILLLKRVKR